MAAAAPRALTFAVHGPILRSDLEGLCARVCLLLGESRAEVAFCDVTASAFDTRRRSSENWLR